MINIPKVEFYNYDLIKQEPGTFLCEFPNKLEDIAVQLMFNLIAEAVTSHPDKKVYACFEFKEQFEDLDAFLVKQKLSKKNIIPFKSAQSLSKDYFPEMSFENTAGIFVQNDFFIEQHNDPHSIQMGFQAKYMGRFINEVNKKRISLILSKAQRENFGFRAFANDTTTTFPKVASYSAKVIISINESTSNPHAIRINCRKHAILQAANSVLEFDKGDFSNNYDKIRKSNFFDYHEEGVIVSVKERPFSSPYKNSYELFDHYKTEKSVKKRILERCIYKHTSKTTQNKFADITYDLLYLYTTMKDQFQDEFDPNFFISETPEGAFFTVIKYKNTEEELKQLIKLVNQKCVYSFFLNSATEIYQDTLAMVKEMNQRNLPINLESRNSYIFAIHDYLSKALDKVSADQLQPLPYQMKYSDWQGNKIQVENQELEIFVPMNNLEFKTIGRDMEICIKNDWFWKNISRSGNTIIILKDKNINKYCLEISSFSIISQARGYNNAELSVTTLNQLMNIFEEKMNQIDPYSSKDQEISL